MTRLEEIINEAKCLCINNTNPHRCLVRELDMNQEFREAVGCADMDIYPQQIDEIVREWQI
jgi:hypothetical protein